MNHKPIANAEALRHIQAARPKLAQALAAIDGAAPIAHNLQLGMGQVMSASRCLKRAMQANATGSAGVCGAGGA
ncbi:MAG: hypothetical protein LBI48_01290 [Burkholderiaceae bacterium]|nr:hypothetical protein [Burkholderiaceae bacterium]